MEKPCLDSLDSSVNALFSIGSESVPENVGTQYPLLKTEILTALSQVIEDHTAKPAQMVSIFPYSLNISFFTGVSVARRVNMLCHSKKVSQHCPHLGF